MRALLDRIPKKTLLLLLDAAFVLWLATEWLWKHTPVSQGAMLLFCALAALLIVRERKLYLSNWFLFSLGVIVWGLIGVPGCRDAATALAMVKTLCVNFVFLLLFYQYAVIRGDIPRLLKLYLVAAGLFLVGVTLLSCPAPFETRLGLKAGVNPNDVALVSASCFAISLYLALENPKKSLYYALAFIPALAAIFFASSLKGLFFVGGSVYVYLLLRYPKQAKRNAVLLLLLGVLVLYLLTMENFLSRWPGIYYRVTYRLQKIVDYLFRGMYWREVSIDARGKFVDLGFRLFLRRPLMGFGLDCFRFFTGPEATYSHNNYIELLVSGGLPMLMLFYAPYAIAIKRGFAARSRNNAVKLLWLLTLMQLIMDWAMVSYFDRPTLIVPLLLLAALRQLKGEKDDWESLRRYASNPCRLLSTRASHGGLKFLPDRVFLPLVYRGRLGKKLRLNPPVGMTEWLQWQKLYDRREEYKILADKLAVRDYVSARVGEDALIPLLGVWERAQDIDFSALPERFALKCTHDSGGVIVCTDRAAFDEAAARSFLEKKLARDYYYTCREWAYKGAPRRVIAEAFIGSPDGKLPDDYKIFCFDGVARAVVLCANRTPFHADYFFLTPDWALFPVNDATVQAEKDGFLPEKPACLSEMLAIAEALSAGVPQLRVDLYEVGGRALFGELTLYDQGGFAEDYVGDGDERMGSFFSLLLFSEKREEAREKQS